MKKGDHIKVWNNGWVDGIYVDEKKIYYFDEVSKKICRAANYLLRIRNLLSTEGYYPTTKSPEEIVAEADHCWTHNRNDLFKNSEEFVMFCRVCKIIEKKDDSAYHTDNTMNQSEKNKPIKPEGDAEMKETSPANERLEMLKSKLEILFEYEKRHLDLLKEYKEEIKFANALQEDLRRERSNFFTQILGEVSESLKKAQVEQSVAAKWLQELVESYTKSLNVSVDLAKICVVEIIGKLREESKENLENIQRETLDSEDNSD